MIYGFARVSIAAQSRNGNSLEAQVTALQKYGCYQIIEESFSGKTMGHPKFQKLLKIVKEGGYFGSLQTGLLCQNCH